MVLEYNAGNASPDQYFRKHLTGLYTPSATGYHSMELHLWRVATDTVVRQYIDNIHVRPVEPSLEAVNTEVLYQTGGQFEFDIDAGPEHAHQMYIILQGYTGCDPGFTVGCHSVFVPLNWDIWTDMALNLNPYWCNFYGILDSQGRSHAQMTTFGPLPVDTNALSLQLVALIFDTDIGITPCFATNPVTALITKVESGL